MAVQTRSAADFRTAEGSDVVTINRCSVVCTAGEAWTARTAPVTANWTAVCWSPELRLFVAVADLTFVNTVMTSPDGVTWTQRAAANATVAWRSVCWSPELGLFVAVGDGGSDANRIMTSSNGTAWTQRTAPASNNGFTAVCWSPQLHRFVAMCAGVSGAIARLAISSDGITWNGYAGGSEPQSGVSICWSPELAGFVCISNTDGKVYWSDNGTAWGYSTQTVRSWRSVCWSPALRLFCAVCDDGTSSDVMTSPDGATWTLRTTPSSKTWKTVCWSPELRLFIAGAVTGIGNDIMTSPDGITWRSVSPAGTYGAICWSPELRQFCSVTTNSGGAIHTSTVDKLQISEVLAGSIATVVSAVRPAAANQNIQGWLRLNVNGVDRFVPYW